MPDREKVIKGLEETEIMLTQAVDRGGEMAVMGAFKCLNCVTDALALLKEQEPKTVKEMLVYDRNQYAKGYYDRDSQIVRCIDCMYYKDRTELCDLNHAHGYPETWFCADGERKDEDA